MTLPHGFRSFAITFACVFPVIYVFCVEYNLALFTYDAAKRELTFLLPRERGPLPMFWYGWIATSLIGAFVVSIVASFASDTLIQRAIIFVFFYAVAYAILYGVAFFIYDRASYELEFLKHPALPAVGGLAAALIVSFFAPVHWRKQLWGGWAVVVPLGVILLFCYLLRSWFV